MKSVRRNVHIILTGLLLLCSASAQMPAAPDDTEDATSAQGQAASASQTVSTPPTTTAEQAALAQARKDAQNPIASVISLPLQENWNFGIGPANRTQNIFLLQPVFPVSISKDWNLIMRFITPIIYQPYAVPVQPPSGGPPVLYQTGSFGLGDIQPQFYFSPRKHHTVTWGAGPVFLLPTATQHLLGQEKFGIGPTFVALAQPKFGTIGVLVNNIWSVAGHSDRPDVNQLFLQPFINYNLKHAWYLSFSPQITANWIQTNGGRWVVPLGGGPGRVWTIGHQAVNVQTFFYGNVVHPPNGSPWTFRMTFTLLFPKPR